MAAETPHLAIVEEEPRVRRALSRYFRTLGFETTTFDSGRDLLTAIRDLAPDVVLTEYHLSDEDVPALIGELRANGYDSLLIVMTGRETPGSRKACLDAGATAFVRKPVGCDELAAAFGFDRDN